MERDQTFGGGLTICKDDRKFRDLPVEVHAHGVDHVPGGIGWGSGQDHMEDAPETVEVRSAVLLPADDLLWTHVRRCADGFSGLGQGGLTLLLVDPGQTKIENLDQLFPFRKLADHDVSRLEVSMQDAVGVGFEKGPGDLTKQPRRPALAEGAAAIDDFPERFPRNMLQDEKWRSRWDIHPKFVHSHDVRMVEPTHGHGFSVEAFQVVKKRVRRGPNDFDHHRSANAQLGRQQNRAHSPVPKQALDSISTYDDGPNVDRFGRAFQVGADERRNPVLGAEVRPERLVAQQTKAALASHLDF